MKFKKAVKSILGGLVQQFSKPEDPTTEEAVEASTQALHFLQQEISNVHSLVEGLFAYKIPTG